MNGLPAFARAACLAGALGTLPAASALAQERPDMIVVFDGSGSMWGQVNGRTKLELARESLSSVLSEISPQTNLGMMVYGHRVRGQCTDIEMAVPVGPASQTVPQILSRAYSLNPRGMTPLVDTVQRAAEMLRYSEQAATVVLLTDGIETCGGDPCVLGRALAAQGIDFTAHVVGFDLTQDEQRQVSCLAHETGGVFLAAQDADELVAALSQVMTDAPLAAPAVEPEPAVLPRNLSLVLRDTADGPALTARAFRSVEILPADSAGEAPTGVDLTWNPGPVTGQATILPGRYRLLVLRETQGSNLIRVALPFEIPEGQGPVTIDLTLAARLNLSTFLNAGQPMPEGMGRLPALRGQGWADMEIHPVVGGAIDASVDYGGINSRDVALPPGTYFIRGTLSGMITRERLLDVAPGATTRADFDFAASPVLVDLRDAQGFPVDRYDVAVFDGAAEEPVFSGSGRNAQGPVPLYLSAGDWRIVASGRGHRAEAVVSVASAGQPVTLALSPGQQIDGAGMAALMAEERPALCHDTHAGHGCVVEALTPETVVAHLALTGAGAAEQRAVRYTGTWQTHGGMMALVQDGRRVWGEIHVNGGIGLVWGHVAPDGLTLRGAMDRSSNPRGVMELRLAADGSALAGRWDHNIGRLGSAVTARRLSGGVPVLARATGTEDDLRLGMNGRAWEPAASADFADFMAPAQAPAAPDTGEDLDAMQALAPPLGFSGEWRGNRGVLSLSQEDRRVQGRDSRGRIEGEVSVDGSELRGIWVTPSGDWGLIALTLDPSRQAFTGGWGRQGDTELRGGDWRGERQSYLGTAPEGAPAALPAELGSGALDGFFAPARDPEPSTPPLQQGRAPTIGQPDLVPAGLDGFVPVMRQDFRHADGRLAASVTFAEGATGDQRPGFVWLAEGWCGQGCPAEILPVGGTDRDSVPNAYVRLANGGIFPALDLSAQGILALESGDTFNRPPMLTIHELAAPYTEASQLRAGVLRSFGPFAGGGMIADPDLSGWPLPTPANPAPVQVSGPAIGAIDLLPEGIYGVTRSNPGERADAGIVRLWTDPQVIADLAMQCGTQPSVVHADGLIAHRVLNMGRAASVGQPYETQSYMRCEQNGPLVHCSTFNTPLSANATPSGSFRAEVMAGPDGSFALSSLDAGQASFLFRSCLGRQGFMDAGQQAPDGRLMIDHMRDREDRAATPASAPADPAVIPANAGELTGLPAGVWTIEAPWSDPMPAPGTPAFRDRCFEAPSVTRTDGRVVEFEPRNTARGTAYFPIFASVCTGGGSGPWPFSCTAEDPNVADAAAARVVYPARFERLDAYRLLFRGPATGDIDAQEMIYYACQRSDGLGIDLAKDPLGPALTQAIAETGLDSAAAPAAASPQAPATGDGSSPWPGLAGYWTPLYGGMTPAQLAPDALVQSCFETVARIHDDGLIMNFRTDPDSGPQIDSFMRCGAGLSCDYSRGSPAEGRPVEGRADLTLRSADEIGACLGSQCLTLARCPGPDWSVRERASGLAERWETAIERRE